MYRNGRHYTRAATRVPVGKSNSSAFSTLEGMTATDGIMNKADPPSSGRRIPPGLSAKLALARRVVRRRILAERLRWIAERYDWDIANRLFKSIAARAVGNPGAAELLSSATLRGARDAEMRGRFTTASRFWVWHAACSGDVQKASRNLARCARLFTTDRVDREAISGALQAWRLLAAMDPESVEAKQGQAWCHTGLARIAEEASDFTTAQAQWSAVLQVLPNDQTALNGLHRTLEVDYAGLPAADGSARAQGLFQRLARETRPDYDSQCAAANILLNAGAPALALGFADAALTQRSGPEAASLLFRCQTALRKYEDAVATLVTLAQTAVSIPAVPVRDLQTVLAHVPPEKLSIELVSRLALAQNARSIAPVLLPYVVPRNLPEALIALSDKVSPDEDWSPQTVLDTADSLWALGEQQRALRILAPFSETETIAKRFALYAGACDAEEIERVEFGASAQLPGFCAACLLIAEIHSSRGDSNRAVGALCRISESSEHAQFFFQTQKWRIAAVVDGLLQAEGVNSEIALRLARVVVSWLPESVHAFYRGSEFSDLYQDIATVSRFAAAPPSSRMGFFREHYFEHHMERRERRVSGALESDFAFCHAVLQYFSNVAELRPAERIPVGAALRARLAKPILSLGSSHSTDVLMSYAILRNCPECDLKSDNLFETLARWYTSEFLPANKVPSACLPPDVLTHFNTVIRDYSGVGIAATRFAHLVREQSQAYQRRYDLESSVDALLFTLGLVAALLPSSPQYRPFIGAMISGGKDECTFADICVAALASPDCKPARALRFSSVLNGCARHSIRRVWLQQGGVPQDVLLIGHGGQGTGLGRNFQMLIEALSGPDISLTTMTYETAPAEFAEELREWYHRCRTRPVVIAAVNAHDIPALFVKDRHDVLYDCQVVGFFLWETSQAPRVQHLGIHLVDEIWTPTNYVASVYSPFAPVHVVGKGLFSIEESTQTPRPAAGSIRFLAIFDFHSSIERKNPLAVVLAFQKAFRAGERVELVLKASNVNPQHPGNASGQWERICAARAGDDRIRIITGRYTGEQMQQLMRDSSCVVSLHRSEGFGYVLSDAMALGIPVIATDYSGNTDFCDQETSYPVSYRTIPVTSHGAHWEEEGMQWAEPDIDSAAAQMRAVYSNYSEALCKATLGRQRILEKYSKEAFAARLRERLAAIVSAPGIDPFLHAVQ